MVDDIISTGDSPPYVLDRLFDSFSNASLSDVDDLNHGPVIEITMMLANLATEPEAKRTLTAGIFLIATRMSA